MCKVSTLIKQQLSATKAYFGTYVIHVRVCVFVSVVGAKYAQFSGLHTNLTTYVPSIGPWEQAIYQLKRLIYACNFGAIFGSFWVWRLEMQTDHARTYTTTHAG